VISNQRLRLLLMIDARNPVITGVLRICQYGKTYHADSYLTEPVPGEPTLPGESNSDVCFVTAAMA
jgi:hypothetical protein